jgi:hypothetical protein
MKYLSLVSFLLTLHSASMLHAQESMTLSELMPRVREALGMNAAGPRPLLQISGRSERLGLTCPFRWTLAANGQFLREFKCTFSQTTGFDGQNLWSQEVRSPSFARSGVSAEQLMAMSWVSVRSG